MRQSGLVQGRGAGQPGVGRGEPGGRLRPHPSMPTPCQTPPCWLSSLARSCFGNLAFMGGSVAILWLWRPVWEGVNALWCMFPLFPTALDHPVLQVSKFPAPICGLRMETVPSSFASHSQGPGFHLLCVQLTGHLLSGGLS